MNEKIKLLGDLCKELDELDIAIFDDETTEEAADEMIDRFNATVEKAAALLVSLTAGQIAQRTAELMARTQRVKIRALVARVR